jgi:pyruvate,water dikinase
LQLAKWACIIEDHYSQVRDKFTPMDIEWAKDGITGEVVHCPGSSRNSAIAKGKQYSAQLSSPGQSEIVAIGRAVGEMIGQGKAG